MVTDTQTALSDFPIYLQGSQAELTLRDAKDGLTSLFTYKVLKQYQPW